MGENIIIGKRITFGAIVGGLVTVLSWASEAFAGVTVPAPVAVAAATTITGIGQVYIVNRYGVTTG